ncbi:MAG: ABC transporter ATP-binding protein/permease [Microthrixaceae bacterium]|nr:ABC transporter ATP-binding protein/permease [Microthrixaceae bacterium]
MFALLPRIEALTGPVRGRLIAIALVSASAGVVEAFLLFLIAQIATSLTNPGDLEIAFGPLNLSGLTTTNLLWLGIGLVPAVFALQIASGWLIADVFARSVEAARAKLLVAHARSPWANKEALASSTLVQLAHSNVSKTGEAAQSSASLIAAGANFGALVLSAVVVDPAAAMAITVGVALLLALVLPLTRSGRRQHRAMVGLNRQYSSAIHDYAAVGREIEVFSVQDESIAPILGLNQRLGHALRRAKLVSVSSTAVFRSSALLLILVLLAVVTWSDTSNVTRFAATALILLRSVSYGQAIQTNLHTLSESMAWVDDLNARISELEEGTAPHLTEDSEPRFGDDGPGRSAGSHPLGLEVRGLSFSYTDKSPVLCDVTLRIEPGELVGVAGISGAGKTTLAELLLGLRAPTDGTISVDGADLLSIPSEVWSKQVGFVPQEPALTAGSVRDNARFHRSWISDDDVDVALEAAGIRPDSNSWGDGALTEVGPLGTKLSGGQRQRVAIARALADNPKLLILDEPTSALDGVSEARIKETMSAVRGSTTVVVIAHRMSTLQACDRLILLAGGQLVGFAPPEELGDLSRYLDAPGQ